MSLKKKKKNLQHELSKQLPVLFYKGMMWKNTKSNLASLNKALVVPMSSNDLQNTYYIVDGGLLLQNVSCPTDLDGCTYGDVCNTYVSYVLKHFGKCTVCFDGYHAVST